MLGDKKFPVTKQVYATTMSADVDSDPVARQYFPSDEERYIVEDELIDPIGDEAFSPVKGIVHRYPDRVLLKITDTCAVYCRFCFRKEMIGKGAGVLSTVELNDALTYLKNTPHVREIILTGGDPLTLSNRRLHELLQSLSQIEHLDIVRIHTRVPLVSPERVDQGLIDCLSDLNQAIYMVLHVNHVQEIDQGVVNALQKLTNSSVHLLSQTVLLKGVNDDVHVLEDLLRCLVKNNIKPYYLHHLDKAKGTSHFRVSIQSGMDLMRSLRGRLSGLCLPTYVLDIPGGYGKMPVNHTYFTLCDGGWMIEDYQGRTHFYEEK